MDFQKPLEPQLAAKKAKAAAGLTAKEIKAAAYKAKAKKEKEERQKMQDGKAAAIAAADKKVLTEAEKSADFMLLRKLELVKQVTELRGADSLQAVIIRRALQAQGLKLAEAVRVRNVLQTRDRANKRYTAAAGRKLTPDETDAIAAERKAAREAIKAAMAHAAANPTCPQCHNTVEAARGAAVPKIVVAETGAEFEAATWAEVLNAAEAPKELGLKIQNYAQHGVFNTGSRFNMTE